MSLLRHINITSAEPEYLELNIHRNEDGEWLGGALEIDIGRVVLIQEDKSRASIVCGATVQLMRSDLEKIAEALK